MNDPTQLLITASKAPVVERIDVPPRPERRSDPPSPFCDGKTGDWLTAMLGGETSVWRHQAIALEHIAAGRHLVVATGTASGKSLIFQAPIVHDLLHRDSVALVLYPQKALCADQLVRWREALTVAGLDPDLVAEINGEIPMKERDRALASARVILATPDAIHCWLMRQVTSPAVQSFLGRLRHLVIDEAHVMEGVFGTNSAYFFRRLRCAKERVRGTVSAFAELQIIAATATIAEPTHHLSLLTGCEFAVVDETDNGAPFHGMTLLHLEGPDRGTPAERTMADILGALSNDIAPNAFIAFADSRQGVEHVTRFVNRDDVLPYRSGYEANDRRKIEQALRAGALAGTVSTSALELGIDIPRFTTGLNLGVPQTRKAFRQRVGRIGRICPGAFAVLAPRLAFAQLGATFQDFYDGSIEPSHLYLDNRIIQFEQARCLMQECMAEDGQALLPDDVEWPDGFAEMFAAAQPGARRPRDLDQVAMLGTDDPHIAYPLRKICEVEFALRHARNPQEIIGKIGLDKALREAYPGATHYHIKCPHKVTEWQVNGFGRSILIQPVRNAQPTRPMLRTLVNVCYENDQLIEQHLRSGEHGSLAETCLRVVESVEGVVAGTTPQTYRELGDTDRRMRRKQREFATTGIVLRIDAPWFNGDGKNQVAARRAVAKAVSALLAREYSIAPGDIRTAHTGIGVASYSGVRRIDDAVVVFDSVEGGLRLTAPLFVEFELFLDRLARAAEMAGTEALLPEASVGLLKEWYDSLSPDPSAPAPAVPAHGQIMIYAPETLIGVQIQGNFIERRIIKPELVMIGDDEELMYRYDLGERGTGLVRHDRVEPVGQDWRRVMWDPETDEIQEIAA